MKDSCRKLYETSYRMRKRFLEIFTNLGYGHLTTAFSETEILVALMQVMKLDPSAQDADRLVLSKGHGAGMVFTMLEEMGLLAPGELDRVIRPGGDFSVFDRYFYPGFHFYGGSLGIGLGLAAGMALGQRLNRAGSLVFCLLGDAECYEGSVWEAVLFAGHNRLNNLIAIVDRNYLGCSDFTENMCALEPFADKWEDCGWEAKKVNGHSIEELLEALSGVRTRSTARPLCIIAETVKGKGLEQFSNIPLMHGFMPKGEQIGESFRNLERIGL